MFLQSIVRYFQWTFSSFILSANKSYLDTQRACFYFLLPDVFYFSDKVFLPCILQITLILSHNGDENEYVKQIIYAYFYITDLFLFCLYIQHTSTVKNLENKNNKIAVYIYLKYFMLALLAKCKSKPFRVNLKSGFLPFQQILIYVHLDN